MYAIIDCNNFYANCERLFRPDLAKKPIVVLSNNDGCVIARSDDAKALGIAMGEPHFKIKAQVKQFGIVVFSSNYTLYGDISQRVMATIDASWPCVEIYSIDEAFLDLTRLPSMLHYDFCLNLQAKIRQEIGMPTSVGIGATKTLAKLANLIAKKYLKIPVFNITQQMRWLDKIDIGDVWGVGRQWANKLKAQGITTAGLLATADAHLIHKQFNVVLMRTALELRGTVCTPLTAPVARQSIIASRSFGIMQTELAQLAEAVSNHAARACEKARSEQLIAQKLAVFVRSNSHRHDLAQYTNTITCKLITPSNDTSVITHAAKICLQKIFRPNIHYKKVGVMLLELIPAQTQQLDLLQRTHESDLKKRQTLMQLMDKINLNYGHNTIKLAAAGTQQGWQMQSALRSPCYTTKWGELPRVLIS